MAEPGNTAVTWAERMELLRDAAQQRVLTAPMPTAAMGQLLADGKANALGRFEDSPVHYMDRWWRPSELGWVALDEASSAQLDLHAERYRAAIAATSAQGTPAASPQGDAAPPATWTEEGAA
ncbi:hypothetical protein ACIQGT_36725 [Streptomyces sp. NPDC093108]|uniref:hypothetical protein n=1 Tax=Streptomyces sp. NPDC093108 TaxID=3366030 RepID=UPI00382FA70B